MKYKPRATRPLILPVTKGLPFRPETDQLNPIKGTRCFKKCSNLEKRKSIYFAIRSEIVRSDLTNPTLGRTVSSRTNKT